MPAHRDEGLCLRHWDWSETSQTVTIFGRTLGLVRGLAKGARRERGRFGGGIDLLSRGEFGVITRPTTELATLTEWDLLETFAGLRDALPSNRIAFYAADLVSRLLAPADPHPGLYDAMVELLRSVGVAGHRAAPEDHAAQTEQTARTAHALLRFQWHVLTETGVQPSLDAPQRPATLWFDPVHGGFSDAAPQRGWRVRQETIDALRRIDAGGATGARANGGAHDAAGANDPVGRDAPIAPIETLDRANRLLATYMREILQLEPPTLTQLFGNLPRGSTASRPHPM